jgi:hypothetical protein
MLPKSRGGTSAWHNVVLACKDCNDRKGDRTPDEAGMPLRIPPPSGSGQPYRAMAYARQTARLLVQKRAGAGVTVIWSRGQQDTLTPLSPDLRDSLMEWVSNPSAHSLRLVVRPIARSRKQVFTARNYLLDTPLRPPYERVGPAVKRRVRVNDGLAFRRDQGGLVFRTVGPHTEPPHATEQVITTGMLCEGQRAEQIDSNKTKSVN